MSEPNQFLNRRQVAALFGVAPSTVTRWAREGLLTAIRTPGGQYRFPAEEMRRLAETHTRAGEESAR
jgi:excisionase family DNA binding protein